MLDLRSASGRCRVGRPLAWCLKDNRKCRAISRVSYPELGLFYYASKETMYCAVMCSFWFFIQIMSLRSDAFCEFTENFDSLFNVHHVVSSSRSSRERSRRMHSKSCLGTSWGARYEHNICKTICFWRRSFVVVSTIIEKRINNYIQWCSQSTKRLDFGLRYEDITIISYYDIMIL